ncbi:location of vulva defective 1-like isoform X2 [Saccostrea cucullata]
MFSTQRPSNLIYLIAVLIVVRRTASITTETPTTTTSTENETTVSTTSEITTVMSSTSTSDATMTSTETETAETTTEASDGTTQSTSYQTITTITTATGDKNDTGVTQDATTVPIGTETSQTQETTVISIITTTEETETTSSDPTTSSPHSTSEISTDETTLDSTTFETTQPSNEITTTSDNTTTSAPDTTTAQPSTTEEQGTTEITNQTTTSTDSVDSTTEMTSTLESTTQPIVTTTKKNHIEAIYPSIENAVLDFTYRLQFKDCSYNKTSIEKELAVVTSTVYGCEYIRVRSIKSCVSGRNKRSTTDTYVSVDTTFGIDAEIGVVNGSGVSIELYTVLLNIPGIDEAYLNNSRNNFSDALTSQSICDADSCRSALIGRPGYICVKENINNTQRCAIMYFCYSRPIDCGGNGECYVETEIRSGQTSYISKCRCKTEEYYRYEGTNCADRVITWQLAVIICISGAAALVLILLFVIISLCCRNSSNSADVSFDESELIYSPSGITSVNQYKNGRSRDSSKGIQNGSYMEVGETSAGGSWRPEDSANT